MAASLQPRIVVVTRETRLKDLLKRWSTKGQVQYRYRMARMAVAMQDNDLATATAAQSTNAGEPDWDNDYLDLENEDMRYDSSVKQLAKGDLDFGMPVQVIDRQFVSTYDFGMCAVVVVIGQDGLVANTAKYVGSVPIIGVNPDPARFDGVLLPFRVEDARAAVGRVLSNQAQIRQVTMAEVKLDDGQSMLAFNDLFVGVKTHVSARYQLRVGGVDEQQSSSGLLISTGAGSTGWMSSVYNMASGVARSLGGNVPADRLSPLPWEERRLRWAVREPFVSRTSGASLVAGEIVEGESLEIESLTPTDGIIFSDGIETDFLEFNGGAIARIGIAAQMAQLVVR